MIGLGSDKNLSLGGELQEGFQLGQGWKENEICVKRKDFHISFSAHIRVYYFSLRHMRAAILGCWRGWLHLHPLSERSVCSKITLWAQERWSMDLLKWPAKQENMKHSKTEVVQIATEGQVTWHIHICVLCTSRFFKITSPHENTVQCNCYQPTRVSILRILYLSCFNMDNTFLIDLRLCHIKSVCNQIWAPIPKDLVIFNIWLFHLRSYTGNEWMA